VGANEDYQTYLTELSQGKKMTGQHKFITGHQERQLHRVGDSPGYRAFHEVYLGLF
jgi:hypothetical protein